MCRPSPATIDRLGADLLALLDHLHVERAHLCGLSLGGLTALWVAALSPRARRPRRVRQHGGATRLDAVVGRPDARRARRRHDGDQRAVVGRFLGATVPRGAPRRRTPHQRHGRGHARRTATSPRAPRCATPICATSCRASVRRRSSSPESWTSRPPLRQSEELHAAIAGSELVVLPGAAHLTNVEQAEEFTRIVTTFLRGL